MDDIQLFTKLRASGRLAGLVASLAIVAPVSAQDSEWLPEMVPMDSTAAPTPWGPGEHLVYRVKLGWVTVGYGHLTVEGLDRVRGKPTYRASMGMNGRWTFWSLDDTYTSWFDIGTLQSWRFTRQNRGSYTGQRHYEFYPARGEWVREDNDEFGPLPTPIPFDEISFIYLIRTLPLKVGETYTFDRYFKETGNPVTIEVLRKDTRKTDAGEFNTIVVRPTFQSEGLFKEDGKAELHFSDDERRLLVYMWVDIPVLPGGISLHLESIQEGFPVNPDSRAEVMAASALRRRADPPSR